MNRATEVIIRAGIMAPSGENCQPWHFAVKESGDISVYLLPERDQSVYSFKHYASYVALGAAIENMVIEATRQGCVAEVSITEAPHQDNLVAKITLRPASIEVDPLVHAIEARTTNRKPYKKTKLTEEQKQTLLSAGNGLLSLADTDEQLQMLGRVGSVNEEVMLSNKQIHQFFFSHVNWTKREDDQKKVGFYIKTLELPPPAQLLFRVFKHWNIMQRLARIGFHKVVGKENAATYAKSGAIGAIAVQDLSHKSFLEAGRRMERIWLSATLLGLQFQPITGVLYFKLRLEAGEGSLFTAEQKQLIETGYADAEKIFNTREKHIAFMFRVGVGSPPSARSVRFSLEESVTIE